MTFRYAPEPAPTAPRERKTSNGVGLAALIVGVVSLVGSVIPLLNYASGFLALVGIVLGIIGLILKDRPKGMALGGLIASVVALILSIVLAIVYTAGIVTAITGAVRESEARSSAEASDEPRVTYQVEGSGGTVTAGVLWTTSVGGTAGSEQASDQPLPFSREVVIPDTTNFDMAAFSVSAVASVDPTVSADGDITCRILVGDHIVTEQRAEGDGATVTCTATAEDLRELAD
ncbi:hypothetical protein [Clavibacter michiganensis]|uniref:hypothetical protein n=1 Tax=Clavibacter michiganensis TaxID=28447 RepID=UPI0009A7F22D|nr:hypothetical protein [Clavibacter michiganensis]MBF4638363.1 hypothetical protein [Clavibacter michiganensis subsp. michiganensis]MDO4027421.1 hypothetical protein [Clavibacter michiganensis]MDO4044076.1 hypothetical protein [Clavibacter michiganensis]MDO4054900.1 hypothetical protein [Clavibacter michiganensis]MDO4056135.1 hypothetical protein [Clavibacter michiganensis]